MEEVLDKGMMERVAFAFPAVLPLTTRDLPRIDNHSSVLRIELANLARRNDAINVRYAAKIIDDETQFLRLHKFHEFFQHGRIKVDWDHLQMNVAIWIADQFDFLLGEAPESELHSTVIENVASLFAEELSELLLFDTESSLDQALSNNLRHGVVVPRFVRSFNEAIFAASDAQSHGKEFAVIAQTTFGAYSKVIRKLQDSIIDSITKYKDFWLTVNRTGDFAISTKTMITAVIAKAMKPSSRIDSEDIAVQIVDKFRNSVDSIIEEAREALLKKIKPAVLDEIQKARLACVGKQPGKTVAFFDMLDTYIEQGFDDVQRWIGLLQIQTNVRDFEFEDLVRFEAMSLIFSDIKKLKVRCLSLRKRNNGLARLPQGHTMRGRFCEAVQEISHNLISNAFRHSGLDMNTDIEMSAIDDNGTLVFRCVNSFSERRAHLMAIVYLANPNRLGCAR